MPRRKTAKTVAASRRNIILATAASARKRSSGKVNRTKLRKSLASKSLSGRNVHPANKAAIASHYSGGSISSILNRGRMQRAARRAIHKQGATLHKSGHITYKG